MSVLRFRTAQQLTTWIRSQERHEALPRLRDKLTRDFSELPRSATFGSTVRVAHGQAQITPAWKTAMLVVLCLYPTAMLLSTTLSPGLTQFGITQPVAMLAGNVISVVLLQWVLVPTASRPFRRWLDPIDGAPTRVSPAGAAIVVVAYAALLLLFAVVFQRCEPLSRPPARRPSTRMIQVFRPEPGAGCYRISTATRTKDPTTP